MSTAGKVGGYGTDENYSSTITYNFNWTINNFEFVCKNVKLIQSRQFSIKNFNDGNNLIITLEPTELLESSKGVFKIYLNFEDKQFMKNEKLLNLEISLKRRDNLQIVHSFFTCHAYSAGENGIFWKISAKDLRHAFIDSAPTDLRGRICRVIPISIDVICDINIHDIIPGAAVIEKSLIDIESSNDLVDNIKSLLHNEDFKDVTFNVEAEKFTAHKNILAIRSNVFAAMFKNKMSEGLTSVVEIDDIKPAIFQQTLNFIYTDQVENLEESAIEFLYVAEKYQLEKLKSLSINSLNAKLSLETVSKTLEAADLYSIELLKNECLKFVNHKRYEIIETKEFQELLLSRPNLSIDILKIKESGRNEPYGYCELR